MRLMDVSTGQEVKVGSKVTDFRGKEWTVVSVEKPKHEGSSGRVYVEDRPGWSPIGFYPTVFRSLFWSRT